MNLKSIATSMIRFGLLILGVSMLFELLNLGTRELIPLQKGSFT